MVKGKVWLSLLLVVCLLVIAGCGSSKTAAKSKVIGKVNGDEITQAEYDNEYRLLAMAYDQQMAKFTANAGANAQGIKISTVKDKVIIDQLKKQAWDDLITQKLVSQAAPKEGIEVSGDEINQISNSADIKKYVQDNHLDADSYREAIINQYLYNGLKEKIGNRAEVTDQDIEDYYKANPAEFKETGGMEVYHILVKTEKEADDILAQLKIGADFAAMAKKYSLDSSKDQGGYVGIANQDTDWVPEFKQAALALKPGEMTQAPVKSQYGYHIIKAGKQIPDAIISLKDAHNKIVLKLQDQKEKEVFTKYLDDLKKKAAIVDLRPKTPASTKPNPKAKTETTQPTKSK